MNRFLRPYTYLEPVAVAAVAAALLPSQPAVGQVTEITQILQEPSPLLAHSSSQGYLGVLVGDVDADSAAKLKLKDVRGAVITLIDHDAPAAQVGLRVNDVVLQINGQTVEGAEQFGRMLREIPAGRKVSLVISRDGNIQTIGVQLVDHKTMEHDVWKNLGNSGDSGGASGPGMAMLPGGDTPSSAGWRFSLFGSSLKVGVLVEPLTTQMADYLGVTSGLMVKQVAHKTQAAAAGLKAFDVILKVGADPIATLADWERALHANQGKPVQLTILREKKQQTLTLQVDSKHNRSAVDFEDLFPSDDCMLMAEAEAGDGEVPWQDGAAFAGQLQSRTEELERQAEQMREAFGNFDFGLDPKQLDELNRQMDEWRRNFNPDSLRLPDAPLLDPHWI
jgi:serine protease Do